MFSQDLLLRLADVPAALSETRDALRGALECKGYAQPYVLVEMKDGKATICIKVGEGKPFSNGTSEYFFASDGSLLVAAACAWGGVSAMPTKRELDKAKPRDVEAVAKAPAECAA